MEPGLRTYILKRVGFAVLMLVGVSIILFTIMRLAPGGPEAVLIGGEFSQEAAAQIRQRLGLDRPIALQYLGWAGAALRGDLGRSFKTGDPVAALILDRLGPTLQLTAGLPPTSCATAGPILRAIGDLCNARSTLGRTTRSAARSGMCELAAVWATATPSPDGPPGSATPVEKAAPLVVTGPTRVPAATKPRGIR